MDGLNTHLTQKALVNYLNSYKYAGKAFIETKRLLTSLRQEIQTELEKLNKDPDNHKLYNHRNRLENISNRLERIQLQNPTWLPMTLMIMEKSSKISL